MGTIYPAGAARRRVSCRRTAASPMTTTSAYACPRADLCLTETPVAMHGNENVPVRIDLDKVAEDLVEKYATYAKCGVVLELQQVAGIPDGDHALDRQIVAERFVRRRSACAACPAGRRGGLLTERARAMDGASQRARHANGTTPARRPHL